MRVKTTYTPTDSNGNALQIPGVYTLSDIEKLGTDLVAAGVTADDGLTIDVLHDGGILTITVEKFQ